MTSRLELLSPHQQTVVRGFLAEESARRRHVLVSLSGAHAYGFPSPDSDIDLKAVHLAPTVELLGFPRAGKPAERLEVIDGVELDYSSNELGGVLMGVLNGNGNYLERFLSSFMLESSEAAPALAEAVRGTLSRRVHRHYSGFATQQLLEWRRGGQSSAKKLLYVLRTALTGAYLLETGQMETDVTQLLERYGLADALELVAQKRRGERADLPEPLAARWGEKVAKVLELLDRARERSPLPEEPRGADDLEALLVKLRRAELDSVGARG